MWLILNIYISQKLTHFKSVKKTFQSYILIRLKLLFSFNLPAEISSRPEIKLEMIGFELTLFFLVKLGLRFGVVERKKIFHLCALREREREREKNRERERTYENREP